MAVLIETERLLLRHWSLEDVPSIVGIYGDPETMRWFGRGVTFSLQELTESLKHVMEEYAYPDMGNHAVVEKESLAVIGHCGVHRGSDGKEAEAELANRAGPMGTRLCHRSRAEVRLATRAFTEGNLPSICAVAHRENLASIAVMRKLRMTFVGECDRYGFPSVIYRIAREDFGRRS